MLDERALMSMGADQLRQYISTLHEGFEHVLGAAGEAHGHVQRNADRSTKPKPGDHVIALARALSGG